ncbi:MAG: hypothetical protein ACO24H_10040 [Polynucleobacter sp.]
MWAINKNTGDFMWGYMHRDHFIVESGANFDPDFSVYVLDEIDIQQQLEAEPVEMNSDYSDFIRVSG